MADTSIAYINIDDSTGQFFFTRKQLELRLNRKFEDVYDAKQVSGSYTAFGLLSRKPLKLQSRTDKANHSYLSVSSSIDVYRHGVEIVETKHWLAGAAKISAGTPGHFVKSTAFGVSETNILSDDVFFDVEKLDPVKFLDYTAYATKKHPNSNFILAIIENGIEIDERELFNGVIEPMPIRSTIFGTSIYYPYEPHGTRGVFGGGNEDSSRACEEILTLDYYTPEKINKTFFLDFGESISVKNDQGVTASVGTIAYFNTQKNVLSPFEDYTPPRDQPINASYTSDLVAAITQLSSSLPPTYVNRKQRSASTGFMYDNVYPAGTDSIAYGGMTLKRNDRMPRTKILRSITTLRDATPIIQTGESHFNDKSTILFTTQSIQYPSMLPTNITASYTGISDLFQTGSIELSRVARASFFDQVLIDSIAISKRNA